MRWYWVSDLVAPAAQAATEAIWIYAYVLVLTPPATAHPGFTAIAFLFVLAGWAGRASRRLPWRSPRNLLCLVPLSLVVLPIWIVGVTAPTDSWGLGGWMRRATVMFHDGSAGLETSFMIGALGLAVWCRGLWLGTVPSSTETLARRFLGGAVALIGLSALLALAKGTGVERFTHTLESLMLSYFIVAPSTMALVHVQALHSQMAARQPLSLVWIAALIIPMTLVAAVGLVFASDLAPVISQLMHVVIETALLIWHAFVWVLYWLLIGLRWLASLFHSNSGNTMHAAGPTPLVPLPWLHPYVFRGPSDIPLYVPAILAVLFVALFGYWLVKRSRVSQPENVDEERSSLWSWQLFCQQVLIAWRALLSRFGKRRPDMLARAAGLASSEPMRTPDQTDIRAVYRILLRWAAAHGHFRQPATTPRELQNELVRAAPQAAASVALITENYERARYGDADIAIEALVASRQATDRLE